ncbi:MAG: class I SAM-dependent methyltransferase [Candidatus Omnitrophica bacterium]|nr:class I SAM-dependent methyltransferase [Candidatus Omnitrophota bacterium]
MSLPQNTDWDRFWKKPATKRFSKISWSKRRVLNILESYLVPGKVALDAGCGSGFFSKVFCDKGMKTIAADYSENALQMAQTVTNGQCRLVKVDFLNERLGARLNQKCDLIFSDGLLEHFTGDEQNKILLNWASVLNSGGVMVTVVPNRFSPWELIRPFYMPGIEEKPFVLKELIELHERNGLNVVSKGGVNTLPFRISPDAWLGSWFGMLLYVIVKKRCE